MRQYLLAGVATVALAFLACDPARAQSPVFPETTQAGKLDGAAPGSVTVSLGGRIFSALEFQSGSGDSGPNKRSSPSTFGYIRLYPNFDYASPAGIHYGAAIEIRTGVGGGGALQGVSSTTNTLFVFSGQGYVSSDQFGKIAFGTPNDAIDQLGVGTGDDFGTGGFYGEYGWANAPVFAMADAYDGDVPKQKLAYYSPSFAGFTAGVSWQPTSVGLNNSGALVENLTCTGGTATTPCSPANGATGAQSRNRVEVAGQFSHAFGPASLKADIGYAFADTSTPTGPTGSIGSYQNVSMINAGAVVNIAGFEVEGSVNTGKFAYNYNDSGSPQGPSLTGAHGTTAYIVGLGYAVGPYSIGAQYYGVRFDQGDYGAVTGTGALNTGAEGRVDGFAVGGSYRVGPGVSVNFDVATDTTKTPGGLQKEAVSGDLVEKTHGTVLGIGTYINW